MDRSADIDELLRSMPTSRPTDVEVSERWEEIVGAATRRNRSSTRRRRFGVVLLISLVVVGGGALLRSPEKEAVLDMSSDTSADGGAGSTGAALRVRATGLDLGAIEVSVDDLVRTEIGWEHNLVLTNPGDEDMYLGDSRGAFPAPTALPQILVADEGCGYGLVDGALAGGCRSSYVSKTIPPGGSVSFHISIFTEIDQLKPVTDSPLTVTRPVTWATSEGFHAGYTPVDTKNGAVRLDYYFLA